MIHCVLFLCYRAILICEISHSIFFVFGALVQRVLMFENGCHPTLEYAVDCPSFMNGVVKQGLHNGVVKYASTAISLGRRMLSIHDGSTTVEVCDLSFCK